MASYSQQEALAEAKRRGLVPEGYQIPSTYGAPRGKRVSISDAEVPVPADMGGFENDGGIAHGIEPASAPSARGPRGGVTPSLRAQAGGALAKGLRDNADQAIKDAYRDDLIERTFGDP